MLKKLNKLLFDAIPLSVISACVSLSAMGYLTVKHELDDQAAVAQPVEPVQPQPVAPQPQPVPVEQQVVDVPPENTLSLPIPADWAEKVRSHEQQPGAFVQFQLTDKELTIRLGRTPDQQ